MLLTERQRDAVRIGTFEGDNIKLVLAVKRLRRDAYRSNGWFAMKRTERFIVAIVNMRLFGRK